MTPVPPLTVSSGGIGPVPRQQHRRLSAVAGGIERAARECLRGQRADRRRVAPVGPDRPAGNTLFTHRVRLASADDIDGPLTDWLRAAYTYAR